MGSAASSIRVLLGEHSIADSVYNRVDVAEIINHPDWNSPTIDNDYAIIRLAKPVTFTNKVAPACLPADTAATYAGVVATVTGWGRLILAGNQHTPLQEVDMTVTTKSACDNAYYWRDITDNMICAAASGKSFCNGDSGGPLYLHKHSGSWNPACFLSLGHLMGPHLVLEPVLEPVSTGWCMVLLALGEVRPCVAVVSTAATKKVRAGMAGLPNTASECGEKHEPTQHLLRATSN